jgi:lysophospholipase L1-like esterase
MPDEKRWRGIKPPFDSGDHLHPGDDGYEAMGRAIPLSPFKS